MPNLYKGQGRTSKCRDIKSIIEYLTYFFNNNNWPTNELTYIVGKFGIRVSQLFDSDNIICMVTKYYWFPRCYRIFCKLCLPYCVPYHIVQIIPKWSIRHYYCIRGYQHLSWFYKKNIIHYDKQQNFIGYWLMC